MMRVGARELMVWEENLFTVHEVVLEDGVKDFQAESIFILLAYIQCTNISPEIFTSVLIKTFTFIYIQYDSAK